MGEEFTQYLHENGIEREASMPQSPQQNGRAERWQQTIVEKAEAMRHHAGLLVKQVKGIDYDEIFSPVARFESIRFLLAHAALNDWEVEAMDVKTAFLYGELDEEIYMEQPEGFKVPGQEHKVCHLLKAIYGLKQAGRQWNKELHNALLELGFTRTYSDAGIYVYGHHGGDLILVVYVDDLLPIGSDR